MIGRDGPGDERRRTAVTGEDVDTEAQILCLDCGADLADDDADCACEGYDGTPRVSANRGGG
jgi:hypothetical protein